VSPKQNPSDTPSIWPEKSILKAITKRQLEVVMLSRVVSDYAEMAHLLGIKPSTVSSYLSAMRRSLGMSDLSLFEVLNVTRFEGKLYYVDSVFHKGHLVDYLLAQKVW
jgi:DNA-binding NarL/FixJ family response regulator